MQTIDEVKRHCRFGAEVDKSKVTLRETVATLDRSAEPNFYGDNDRI